MKTIELVQNEFNRTLQPLGDERILIGYVEEVNGPGARERPEFVPTRHELLEIAKYWERVWLRETYSMWGLQMTGSTPIRLTTFADIRIGRIAKIVGEEAVLAATNTVLEEFGKGQNPRTWRRFLEGFPPPAKRK
jgi:hypothetical protein